MNKDALKALDLLLQDYEDSERDFYLHSKSCLEEGVTYTISSLTVSDKQEECRPLNLIKPFFVLFYTTDARFYEAKYKKRKILTSFRGNLTAIPLCMDDHIQFKIFEGGKTVFTYTGLLHNMMTTFPLTLKKGDNLSFEIKLIEGTESRPHLEREMESHYYINNILTNFIRYNQSSRFVVSKNKQNKINSWFAKSLQLKNYDLNYLSMEHLKVLSKNILILEKIITSLKYGELSLIATKEIESYEENLKSIMQELDNGTLRFSDNKVVLNCKFESNI